MSSPRLKTLVVLSAFALVAAGTLSLFAQETVEKEPNNERAQANVLALDDAVKGFANDDGDEDWFALTIPAPGLDILVIEASGPEDIDLMLVFCDASGKELSVMDGTHDERPETLVRLRQAPGKFFVKVVGARVNTETPYILRARKWDKPAATAEEVRTALARALDHLAGKQEEDGSWPGYEQAGAGLAIQAFLGGKCIQKDYTAKLRAGLDYLRSQFTPASGFADDPAAAAKEGGTFGTTNMYQQAIATLGVIEALVDLDDRSLEPIAEGAVQLILRAQNTDHKLEVLGGPIPADSPHYGSWRYEPDYTDGDMSISAWQILTLRAAVNAGFAVPEAVFAAAAKYVRSMAGADGSFCYDVVQDIGDSCCRAGMGALALQLTGFAKDPLVARAIRYMQASGPVWNLEYPGEGYPFYYWYYGTRAMYLAGGEDWRVWKDYMCRFLIDHQNGNGGWDGAQAEDKESLESYRTALGALMLEFCCGQVPIYMSSVKRGVSAEIKVVFEKSVEAEAPKTVEIIMDASNSMIGKVGKET
jgi:hypothetical protein